MKKGPWYIWLSIPAFMLLPFFDTSRRVLSHERKNKISKLDKESVWFKLTGHLLGTWLVFVMLPAFLLGHLFYQIAGYFEAGSLLAGIFGNLLWAVLYFAGVYATYRHVLWREKNIPHLLKSKGNKK